MLTFSHTTEEIKMVILVLYDALHEFGHKCYNAAKKWIISSLGDIFDSCDSFACVEKLSCPLQLVRIQPTHHPNKQNKLKKIG